MSEACGHVGVCGEAPGETAGTNNRIWDYALGSFHCLGWEQDSELLGGRSLVLEPTLESMEFPNIVHSRVFFGKAYPLARSKSTHHSSPPSSQIPSKNLDFLWPYSFFLLLEKGGDLFPPFIWENEEGGDISTALQLDFLS